MSLRGSWRKHKNLSVRFGPDRQAYARRLYGPISQKASGPIFPANQGTSGMRADVQDKEDTSMGFFDAVKACFGKYATFKGRAIRSEFWYWTLFTWILSIVAFFLDGLISGGDAAGGTQVISTLVSLVVCLPGIAVAVRRLHDVNRSGWWFLLSFTVIGIILLLFWFVLPGKDEGNAY